MQKWEYVVLNHFIPDGGRADGLQKRLEEFASEGYRVIHVASSPTGPRIGVGGIHILYTLEREKKR